MKLIPEIVTLPSRTFAGLQTRFISAISPATNNLDLIPKLWAAFIPRGRETATVEPDVMYGLCDCVSPLGEKGSQPDEIFYLAAVQVENGARPPHGMVTWSSPGGTFAKFIHLGRIERIAETMGYIHGKWFPGSDHELASGPELERYDSRFNPQSDTSVMELFIPVCAKKEKS